jgi:AcrR family transcriptional regulator
MPRSADHTRHRLIAAGEQLFAERGIDNVSLREISRTSGSRNVMALQHHFADRDGLLQAIVDKHHARVEARRNHLLGNLAGARPPSLLPLAAALVGPFAACLVDDDGGRYYLQILADLLSRPRFDVWPRPVPDQPDSLERWRALVNPYLTPTQRKLHRRFAATLYVVTELSRWSRRTPPYDIKLISSSLADIVEGILRAGVSHSTRAALRRHGNELND